VEERAHATSEGDSHPLVGQIIGERYRIEALLGEGGMGAVFRATHLGLGRPVAVKVLHPRLSADDNIAKRFDREALAVSKLDHPNCVQVIDFGTTRKGMKYLVMQFLEGKELRDLTGVALPIEQVVYLGIQVLRALEHAHKRGLVHRDLKPENIFLVQDDDGNEVVKLVDFGIVKLLEDTPQEKLTRLGMAFGTPTYMSPEQAAGGVIDPRTDLYSVGVLLHELLTGAPPFEADEPGILLRMHILADPPPLPDTVPRAVVAVVAKLLAKDPGDRYPDAREARRALAAAYKLPAKITGLVGFAPVATDAADSSADSSGIGIIPDLAALGPNASTDPATRALDPAQAQARAPTAPADLAATRAEPAPELFVRSGGTVLAPPTHPPDPAAAASTSRGAMPMHDASMSHGAMPMHDASMSHGVMPMHDASMSHGAVPIAAPHPGAPRYDPLAMSSPALPVMGPGLHASGAYVPAPYGAVPPTSHPAAGRRNGTAIVVVLVVVTWIAIALVWLASRSSGAPKGGPTTAAPAPSAPAGGVYRFADGPAPAAAGTPTPEALTPALTLPSPTAEPSRTSKGESKGKGKDKDKKPKHAGGG
jgi:serine/threonine protein kinase